MSKTDYIRAKMTQAERAKQFMPFAALKGYEEALRKVEEAHERGMEKEKSGESGPGDSEFYSK